MKDLDPVYYQKNSCTQNKAAWEILENIPFKGDELVFDVGCGDGKITHELAQLLNQGRVVGFDPSFSMIQFAKTAYPELEFIQDSAENLNYPKKADCIILMNCLHWIRNPYLALLNCIKNLKKGGKLIILTYPQESPYWNFLIHTENQSKWRTFKEQSASKTILPFNDYIYLLKGLGMEIEKSSLTEHLAIYATQKDLEAYVKGWITSYLPLSDALQEIFLEEACQEAQKFSKVNDQGAIHLPYIKLNLCCTKIAD